MANNKYKFELAWKYLNSCTYFTKPYFNDDGSLITFSNEFKDSLDITVDQNFVYLECGSWSLDSKAWHHDYKLNTKGTSFEKAIVKLYRKIYKICGADYTDDYFHIDDIKNMNKCFVKQEDGNYRFVPDNSNSYWHSDILLEKVKSFQKVKKSVDRNLKMWYNCVR